MALRKHHDFSLEELNIRFRGKEPEYGRQVAKLTAELLKQELPRDLRGHVDKLEVKLRWHREWSEQRTAQAIFRGILGQVRSVSDATGVMLDDLSRDSDPTEPMSRIPVEVLAKRPADQLAWLLLDEQVTPAEVGNALMHLPEDERLVLGRDLHGALEVQGREHPQIQEALKVIEDIVLPTDVARKIAQGSLPLEDLENELYSLAADVAEERALELLEALDVLVKRGSADVGGITNDAIGEGREALFDVLTEVRQQRNSVARQEVGRLQPDTFRSAVLAGFKGLKNVTRDDWENIKFLLREKFGGVPTDPLLGARKFFSQTAEATIEGYKLRGRPELVLALDKTFAFLRENFPQSKVDEILEYLRRAERAEPRTRPLDTGPMVRLKVIPGKKPNELSEHVGTAIDVAAAFNPRISRGHLDDLQRIGAVLGGDESALFNLKTFGELNEGLSQIDPDALLKAAKALVADTQQIQSMLVDAKETAAQLKKAIRKMTGGASLGDEAEQLISDLLEGKRSDTAALFKLLGITRQEHRKQVQAFIKWRREAAGTRGGQLHILNLPPELIVALMHPKGGNLRWIVASGDPHHFELKQDIGKEIKKEIEQSK